MTEAPISISKPSLGALFEQNQNINPPELKPKAPLPVVKKIDPSQIFKNNDSPKNEPDKPT